MACITSYCVTLGLWILGLLGLVAVQVIIDVKVQDYLGQAATGMLMIIVISIKYNPLHCCLQEESCFRTKKSEATDNYLAVKKKDIQEKDEGDADVVAGRVISEFEVSE